MRISSEKDIREHFAPKLTNKEVRDAIRDLRRRGLFEDTDGLFQAWIHAEQEADLIADPNILSIFQYSVPRGENNPLLQGSVPSVYGCKFWRYHNIADRPTVAEEDYVVITGSSLTPNAKHLAIFKGFLENPKRK